MASMYMSSINAKCSLLESLLTWKIRSYYFHYSKTLTFWNRTYSFTSRWFPTSTFTIVIFWDIILHIKVIYILKIYLYNNFIFLFLYIFQDLSFNMFIHPLWYLDIRAIIFNKVIKFVFNKQLFIKAL